MKPIEYKVGGKINAGAAGLCTIVKVHSFGTLDVVNKAGQYFRITGLPVYE